MMKDLQISHFKPALDSCAALSIEMAALDENDMFGPEFTIMGEIVIP